MRGEENNVIWRTEVVCYVSVRYIIQQSGCIIHATKRDQEVY